MTLPEFLEALTDEAFFDKFMADPISTLASSGMSEEEIRLIQRGNVQQLRSALGKDDAAIIVRIVVGIVRPPHIPSDPGQSA